ncbi:ATP-binding protein [Kurthia gibsonii]|uniref:ATP-binding protein n=1 Tax=Kurthia gibsonii TaxID=33946 RepID=UPI00301B44A5
MNSKQIGQVLSSSPENISIALENMATLEEFKSDLQVGKYLKIADGNNNYIVGSINNIKALEYDILNDLKLIIETQPIGILVDNEFKRGVKNLPVPTEPVYVLKKEDLDKIYGSNSEYKFPIGVLSQNEQINVMLNGDKFFGKHIAIVGSTGAGKSNAVAKILQTTVGINNSTNINLHDQKNSHIIIFDLHSEYNAAFTLENEQDFNLNKLSVENLKLPYWLMNSEELESIFIESSDNNSHNQVSMFKNAVILNKERHNPEFEDITYDTPVYFDIGEVHNYIENVNREIIGKLDGENCPKLKDGTLIRDRETYFDEIFEFVPTSTAKDSKASVGPFNGEFNRFLSRLETKLKDKRLKFILKPEKENGELLKTTDFEEIIKQFLGYLNKANVTIIDLSGIPFEVLSISVSLVSRLIFDFCFHYSKIQHEQDRLNDIPVLLVCEEAHNYIPRIGGAEYKSSKKSIERIAKEGRKYGLSLMIVSQRPSEVSETVFAQCNNFVSLRLTNQSDQSYVKNLLPEGTRDIGSTLPNLTTGEAIVVGDSVIMPTIIKMEKPNPEPKSQSIEFEKEWDKKWKDIEFSEVIKRWRKEENEELVTQN